VIVHTTAGGPAFTGADAVDEFAAKHGKSVEWIDWDTFALVGGLGFYRLAEAGDGWVIQWIVPKPETPAPISRQARRASMRAAR